MANPLLTIHTPRGAVIQEQTRTGKVRIHIEWARDFGPRWTAALQGVQARFDEEVLRITEPYVPMYTGMLRTSAKLASSIGDGQLEWATPYAAAQYYGTKDSRPYSAQAGGHWGERMKADNLSYLANFVKKQVKNSD